MVQEETSSDSIMAVAAEKEDLPPVTTKSQGKGTPLPSLHKGGGSGKSGKGKGAAPPPPPPSSSKGGGKSRKGESVVEKVCESKERCDTNCSIGGVLECCAAHLASLNTTRINRKDIRNPEWEDGCARAFSSLIADAAIQAADWSKDAISSTLMTAPHKTSTQLGKIVNRSKQINSSVSPAKQANALLLSSPVTTALAPLAAQAPRMELSTFKGILDKSGIKGPRATEETISFIRAKPLSGPDFNSAQKLAEALEPSIRVVFRRAAPADQKKASTQIPKTKGSSKTFRDLLALKIANNERAGSILADSIPRSIPGELSRLAALRLSLCQDPEFKVMQEELKCNSFCSSFMCDASRLRHLSTIYVPERPMDGLPAGADEARVLLEKYLLTTNQSLPCSIPGIPYEAAIKSRLEQKVSTASSDAKEDPCKDIWTQLSNAMRDMATLASMLKEAIPSEVGGSDDDALRLLPLSSLVLLLTFLKIISESQEYRFAEAPNELSADLVKEARELKRQTLLSSPEIHKDFLSEEALITRYITRPLTAISTPIQRSALPAKRRYISKVGQEPPAQMPAAGHGEDFKKAENNVTVEPSKFLSPYEDYTLPDVRRVDPFLRNVHLGRVGNGSGGAQGGYTRAFPSSTGVVAHKIDDTGPKTASSTMNTNTTTGALPQALEKSGGVRSRVSSVFGSILGIASQRATSKKKDQNLRKAQPSFFSGSSGR